MMDDFENFLAQRYIPSPSSNLAQRIIEAGKNKPKVPKFDTLWAEILFLFALPRPVYAMAITLFFGLILGLEAGGFISGSSFEWGSFMDMDEGEWL